MKESAIKAQITKHIKKSMNSRNPRYNNWYVGITNNLKRRKLEHNTKNFEIKFWKSFDAETLNNANNIEAYFSQKGTSNLPSKNGATENSKYVYIFKLPTKKPRGLNGAFTLENLIDYLLNN